MHNKRNPTRFKRRRRKGIAYILSLVLLALCTSLAVAMSAGTNLNLSRSDNMQKAFSAQIAAEGGLEFVLHCLGDADLPKDTDYDTLISNLASALEDDRGHLWFVGNKRWLKYDGERWTAGQGLEATAEGFVSGYGEDVWIGRSRSGAKRYESSLWGG